MVGLLTNNLSVELKVNAAGVRSQSSPSSDHKSDCFHHQVNAAGAIGVLGRGQSDNQAALIRCGAIPLLCSVIKEGFQIGGSPPTGKLPDGLLSALPNGMLMATLVAC